MDINPIILAIPLYFLLIVVELLVQFFSKKNIYRLNDAVTNVSCGITQQITGAFLKVITIAAYQYVFEYWSIFNIPITWWSVILLILAVDFCYYWAHRMSHEVNLFWGGHVVHHQSEDYNFSVALRQGSFQALWTFWFYIPLAFLGFDTVTFLLISALNTVYQFWIHTETIGKLPKPFELIFNTPSHHRVHHGRNPKYIDKNHAGSLIIWDRLFGTFQEEEETPTYGITTPINTWNPVWANLQHYVNMTKEIRNTPGLKNKLRILSNKPGWKPAELGGYQAPKEVDRTAYHKYDVHPSIQRSLYVMIQFIILLGATSFYLFNIEQLSLGYQFLFSGLIIWSVAQFGLILDNQSKWIPMEYVRLLTLVICAVYTNIPWAFIAGVISYSAISALIFYSLSQPKPKRRVTRA